MGRIWNCFINIDHLLLSQRSEWFLCGGSHLALFFRHWKRFAFLLYICPWSDACQQCVGFDLSYQFLISPCTIHAIIPRAKDVYSYLSYTLRRRVHGCDLGHQSSYFSTYDQSISKLTWWAETNRLAFRSLFLIPSISQLCTSMLPTGFLFSKLLSLRWMYVMIIIHHAPIYIDVDLHARPSYQLTFISTGSLPRMTLLKSLCLSKYPRPQRLRPMETCPKKKRSTTGKWVYASSFGSFLSFTFPLGKSSCVRMNGSWLRRFVRPEISFDLGVTLMLDFFLTQCLKLGLGADYCLAEENQLNATETKFFDYSKWRNHSSTFFYLTHSLSSELYWNASTVVHLSIDFHLVVAHVYYFLSFSSVKGNTLNRIQLDTWGKVYPLIKNSTKSIY